MIYDNSGPYSHQSLRRPVRRTSLPAGETAEDKASYIVQVAEENPRWTPDEVYEEISCNRGRSDISREMVHRVLG